MRDSLLAEINMKIRSLIGLLAAPALAASLALGVAAAQDKRDYKPEPMQEGKDVVWLPSPAPTVETMLDMARLKPDDLVIDLGSGDGITVIAAARRGVQALGIEYDADLVEYAKRNAERAGVANRARFVRGDFFETDFSQATVLTLFIQKHLNLQLRPTILKMRPGTRVLSNFFDMGEWKPDETAVVRGDCVGYCVAHLWIVPADVSGIWKTPAGKLKLEQTFQTISGTLENGNVTSSVQGKLIGERIYLTAGRLHVAGTTAGNAIEGVATENGKEASWRAIRIAN